MEGRLPVRSLTPEPLAGQDSQRGSRRVVLGSLLFLVVLAAGVTARAVWVWRTVAEKTAPQLAISLDATWPSIALWRDTYLAQAGLIARLAALDARGPRLEAMLGALDTRHGLVDGWIYVPDGRRIAGPPGAPPAPRSGAAPVRPGIDRAGAYVDFVAPIETTGIALLRVRLTDTTFGAFNPAHPTNRGGRTTLLARDGDSVLVLATASSGGDAAPARRLALAQLPPHARAALDGRASRGQGRGVFDPAVVYASIAVAGSGWALVREQRTDVLLALVRPAILIEAAIFATLGVLIGVTTLGLVRSVRARRATTLAQLRADFVSAVSHELRTPLAQIRLFAELLRKGGLRDAAEADRALGIIEKESSRLTILVDNILSYTSLRRRQRFVTPLAADVPAEVRQVIESFAPLAAERGAQVVADVEAGARARIDTQALRQVLLNFLENAVKYGPKGQTVTVGARLEHVGTRVRVWVDDEGPGVPPAERAAVWDAFYRTDSAQRSGVGGSGLGLAVVRDLVAQYGGAVRVEDAPTGGARFVAELPSLAPVLPT